MSLSTTFPNITPSLNLNFLGNNRLDPRITFTRASTTATYVDYDGNIKTATNNEPRFDHDPVTLAPLGFLIEEARTNSVRNNTMQGASVGTPGTMPTYWSSSNIANGISRDVTAIGVEDGINYIDIRIYGTANTTGNHAFTSESSTQVAAASGQGWSGSAYVKLVGGSLANVVITNRTNGRDSGGVLLESVGTLTLTPTSAALRTQRAISSGTFTNASIAYATQQVVLAYNSGAVVDVTIRIGLPQLEQGAFATSVIPTSNAAVTRAADVATINTLSPWFNPAEGTLYAKYTTFSVSQVNGTVALSDGTNNNRMIIRATNASSQTVFIGVNDNTTVWSGVLESALANIVTNTVFAYKLNDIAWVRNGGTVGTDSSATIPVVNQLKLGVDGGGTFPLNGYLQRITYYPRRLTNSELQALTK
jgi:hypothetical protein